MCFSFSANFVGEDETASRLLLLQRWSNHTSVNVREASLESVKLLSEKRDLKFIKEKVIPILEMTLTMDWVRASPQALALYIEMSHRSEPDMRSRLAALYQDAPHPITPSAHQPDGRVPFSSSIQINLKKIN